MEHNNGHPARVLFDSNFKPGLLSNIVEEERVRATDEADPSPSTLKEAWTKYQCPNIPNLIDHIVRKTGLTQIGSGSIDLDGVMRSGDFSHEKAMRLQELYIGSVRLKISPLRWLLLLSRGFDRVPVEFRGKFDEIIGELVTFGNSTPMPMEN